MAGVRFLIAALAAFACVLVIAAARPAPAQAFNPVGTVCSVAGWVSGVAGGVCEKAKGALSLGKSLLTGHVGSAIAGFGLLAIGAWVAVGAKDLLADAATATTATTSPQLTAGWFSAEYWRMAAIGALLTVPFLMAAAVQAVIRSDLALLVHAAFVSLPIALLLVAIAAPLTLLLLAATDEMCGLMAGASGHAGTQFLGRVAAVFGAVAAGTGSPYVAFLVGFLTALGALAVWIELVMREAAVYIVVLMLPLVFAAFVWPARRMWAIRIVELLLALILAKFAIVAVISLGGAALNSLSGVSGMVAGAVLVLLAAFTPWAVVRLLPVTESAAAAGGSLRESWEHAKHKVKEAHGKAVVADEQIRRLMGSEDESTGRDAALALIQGLRRDAPQRGEVAQANSGGGPTPSREAPAGAVTAAAESGGEEPAESPTSTREASPSPDAPARRDRGLEDLPDVFREPNHSRTYRFGSDELVPPGPIPWDPGLGGTSGGRVEGGRVESERPSADPEPLADDHDPRPPADDRDPLPPTDGVDPVGE